MWQQISNNKRNTIILLIIMLFLLPLAGAICGVAVFVWYDNDINDLKLLNYYVLFGAVIALIIFIAELISVFTNGVKSILSINNAYKLPPKTHQVLENVVEEMTIAAGLPKKPDIYVIDNEMPNAFASGLTPENSVIAVTTGLLTRLNRDELQGVIAHEIAHIHNRDTMYLLFTGVMICSVTIISEAVLKTITRTGSRRSSSNSGGNVGLIITCILLILLAVIATQILYFLVSQKREYLADACAAQFTRYPQGLASALEKISSFSNFSDEQKTDAVTSAMFIVNPKENNASKINFINEKSKQSLIEKAFSTHPPTKERIKILLKMTGADLNSYNKAFLKVSGKPVLNQKDLAGVNHINIEKNSNTTNDFSNAIVASAFVQNSEKVNLDERDILAVRKREAEDIIWKANNYIFRQCECGTKLKFPQEYAGQSISCPHCKKLIEV